MMNWKGFGSKGSWPYFKEVSQYALEGLSKTTRNLRIAGLQAKF
jgi:hypothetical protein